MNESFLRQHVLDRFLRYIAIDTQSSHERADAGIQPSSEGQIELGNLLVTELIQMGLTNTKIDENGYVLAHLPASTGLENKPSFGLCSHLDTAAEASGKNVKAQIVDKYDGSVIHLSEGHSIDPATDSALAACVGETIITSDGTTLLGADNKAGIAGIMTLVHYLTENPEIQHGPIEIVFSPDEETGHGMDRIPLEKITSKAFYTVDGGQVGEIETECFNAWKCDVVFTGIAAHLGTARGKMVNAVSMAASFVSALPARESPETTSGYEGYFCPLEINGSGETASVTVYLRDFDLSEMEKKLDRVDVFATAIEAQFPGGKVSVTRTKQYLNMKEKLDRAPHVLELLKRAAKNAGVATSMSPIRGGTDGSRLTEMGIPTPNIFTGGHNFHSRIEWASLEQMTAMVKTLIELAKVWGE